MRRWSKRTQRLISWGAVVGVGLLIAWLAARARGLQGGISPAMAVRYWSDGCFVAALLIGGFGLLIWISTTGVLDIFSYGLTSLLTLFTPFKKPENHPSYLDYKTYRAEKRKPARLELLVAGAIYLLASILLLAIYHRMTG